MLKADGFDDCIVGVGTGFGRREVLVYDTGKIIEKLMKSEGMSHEDATEYFEFNIMGSYIGEGMPLFMNSDLDAIELELNPD